MLSNDETIAYVADWSGGVVVLDVSDPAQPHPISSYGGTEVVQDISLNENGDTLFVADWYGDLHVVDVSILNH